MDRQQELELVTRLRAGDTKAFDAVYEAFRPRLFSFLARLSGRCDVAEDLLQETWIRLATRAPALRPDSRLGPWLFTVARNLFLSHLRFRLLDAERAGEMTRLDWIASGAASPFEAASANETARQLETALATLPLRYREAVLLVAVEGLSHEDAATVCQISPEALRQRLSRARAMLSRKLDLATPERHEQKEVQP